MPLKKAGLTKLRREIAAAADRGVQAAGGMVKDLAEQLAPYDAKETHKHLNESIEVRIVAPGHCQVVAGVGLPDERAPAQEYGTVDSPAQPYLTPAAEAIDLAKEVKREVNALIRSLTP